MHRPWNSDDKLAAELRITKRRRNRIAVFKPDLDPAPHRVFKIRERLGFGIAFGHAPWKLDNPREIRAVAIAFQLFAVAGVHDPLDLGAPCSAIVLHLTSSESTCLTN